MSNEFDLTDTDDEPATTHTHSPIHETYASAESYGLFEDMINRPLNASYWVTLLRPSHEPDLDGHACFDDVRLDIAHSHGRVLIHRFDPHDILFEEGPRATAVKLPTVAWGGVTVEAGYAVVVRSVPGEVDRLLSLVCFAGPMTTSDGTFSIEFPDPAYKVYRTGP